MPEDLVMIYAEKVEEILRFVHLSERLKLELRHSWLSDGRQESVAEHSWHMALLACLLHSYLDQPVDLGKTLKMVLIHDLVEAEVGDVPFFDVGERKKNKKRLEDEAIEKIRGMLSYGQEIYDLWHEFEQGATLEAKFAKALDNLEVQIQHNLASMTTWEEIEYPLVFNKMDKHCAYDSFLKMFCDAVKKEGEEKLKAFGIDVELVKEKALASRTQ